MEILMCVKRVPDSAENEISVGPGGADIAREDLVYSVNEWDNYAVEEAIQNPKAPIFQAATVGVVADLMELVPVLTEKIQKSR